MNRRAIVTGAVAIAVAILAGIGWQWFRDNAAVTQADRWEDHTFVVIQRLEELLSDLTGAETGERGFVITGAPAYLEPYQHALGSLEGELAALRSLTRDNPRQQARLAALEPLVRDKLAQLKHSVDLRSSQGFEPARDAVSTGRGKTLMDQIRGQVAEAKTEEFRLLKERAVAKEAGLRATFRLTLIGGIFSAALLLAAFWMLVREVGTRARVEEALLRHRDRLEEMVDDRTQQLRAVGDNLPDSAVYQFVREADDPGRFVYFSAGLERLTGIRVQEVLRDAGALHREIPPEHRQRLAEAQDRSQRELSDFDIEVPIRRPDGELRWMRLHSRPRRLPDGRTLWDGVQTDITEQTRAEAAQAMLAAIVESSEDAIISKDLTGTITSWNLGAERLLGYRREEIVGQPITRIIPPELHAAEADIVDGRRHGESAAHLETTRIAKDGRRIPVSLTISPVRDALGAVVGASKILHDITERRQAEEALRLSLREKEAMLKEIHHRVKNNLQVIASLVDLQTDALADPALQVLFHDVRDRVRSMALVHEKLYQSESLARVEFADYARTLLAYLAHSHAPPGTDVALKMELQPVSLSVKTAVPCGLILNELVTNAFKHAFPGRTRGEVTVALGTAPDGRVFLRASDDGVGLPQGMDWRQSRSLGLRLIDLLAGQLQATIDVSSDGGTRFQIAFWPGNSAEKQ